jgi:hypothetical protein
LPSVVSPILAAAARRLATCSRWDTGGLSIPGAVLIPYQEQYPSRNANATGSASGIGR